MPKEAPENLSFKELLTAFTMVATLIGAAVSFGVMYGKVERLDDSNKEFNVSLQRTREELVEVKSQNKQLLDIIQDIKSDIHSIKQRQEATATPKR